MRCVIWNEDTEIYGNFKSSLAHICELSVASTLEELQTVLGRGDVKTVFLSLSLGQENWDGIKSSIRLQMPEVKWVFFSDGAEDAVELTAHQKTEQPADGYLVGPLNPEMILDYFEDIILVEDTMSNISVPEDDDMELDFGSGLVSSDEINKDSDIEDISLDMEESSNELVAELNSQESDEIDLDAPAINDPFDLDLDNNESVSDPTIVKPVSIEEMNLDLDMNEEIDLQSESVLENDLLNLDNQKDSGLNLNAENFDEGISDSGTSSMDNASLSLSSLANEQMEADEGTMTETSLDLDKEKLPMNFDTNTHTESGDNINNELSMLHLNSGIGEMNNSNDQSMTSINVLKENFNPHSIQPKLPNTINETHGNQQFENSDLWRANDSKVLSETLAEIKNDRAGLLKEIQMLKNENVELRRKDISYRTEIEDLKVELELMRNRTISQNQDLKFQLQLVEDKKSLLEQKAKDYQEQYQQLADRNKIDHNQVKEKEIQLQGQLDLLKADSKAQVENRENVIIELKRKIDNLEFNIENIAIKEDKSKQDRLLSEQKMNKVVSSLRFCLDVLESDEDNTEKLQALNKLKNIG